MITACCGHEITDLDKASCVWQENDNCLAYGCLCEECKKDYPIITDVEKWKETHWGKKKSEKVTEVVY